MYADNYTAFLRSNTKKSQQKQGLHIFHVLLWDVIFYNMHIWIIQSWLDSISQKKGPFFLQVPNTIYLIVLPKAHLWIFLEDTSWKLYKKADGAKPCDAWKTCQVLIRSGIDRIRIQPLR